MNRIVGWALVIGKDIIYIITNVQQDNKDFEQYEFNQLEIQL